MLTTQSTQAIGCRKIASRISIRSFITLIYGPSGRPLQVTTLPHSVGESGRRPGGGNADRRLPPVRFSEPSQLCNRLPAWIARVLRRPPCDDRHLHRGRCPSCPRQLAAPPAPDPRLPPHRGHHRPPRTRLRERPRQHHDRRRDRPDPPPRRGQGRRAGPRQRARLVLLPGRDRQPDRPFPRDGGADRGDQPLDLSLQPRRDRQGDQHPRLLRDPLLRGARDADSGALAADRAAGAGRVRVPGPEPAHHRAADPLRAAARPPDEPDPGHQPGQHQRVLDRHRLARPGPRPDRVRCAHDRDPHLRDHVGHLDLHDQLQPCGPAGAGNRPQAARPARPRRPHRDGGGGGGEASLARLPRLLPRRQLDPLRVRAGCRPRHRQGAQPHVRGHGHRLQPARHPGAAAAGYRVHLRRHRPRRHPPPRRDRPGGAGRLQHHRRHPSGDDQPALDAQHPPPQLEGEGRRHLRPHQAGAGALWGRGRLRVHAPALLGEGDRHHPQEEPAHRFSKQPDGRHGGPPLAARSARLNSTLVTRRSAGWWEISAAGAAVLLGLVLRLDRYRTVPFTAPNPDEWNWAWAGLSQLLRMPSTGSSLFWHAYPAAVRSAPPPPFNEPLVHPYIDAPPVFTWLVGAVAWLDGDRSLADGVHDPGPRLLGIALSIVALVLAYLLGRLVLGVPPPAVRLWLMAVAPIPVVLDRLVAAEQLLAVLLLAGLLAVFHLRREPGNRRWLGLLLACCLVAPGVKTPGLVVGVSAVLLFAAQRQFRLAALAGGAAVLGEVAVLAYTAGLDWGSYAGELRIRAGQLSGLTAFRFITNTTGFDGQQAFD